ncbi:uncharacterized [Tachysurus ichikawai]
MRPASILKPASKPGDPVIHQMGENNVQRRVPAREEGLKEWRGEETSLVAMTLSLSAERLLHAVLTTDLRMNLRQSFDP